MNRCTERVSVASHRPRWLHQIPAWTTKITAGGGCLWGTSRRVIRGCSDATRRRLSFPGILSPLRSASLNEPRECVSKSPGRAWISSAAGARRVDVPAESRQQGTEPRRAWAEGAAVVRRQPRRRQEEGGWQPLVGCAPQLAASGSTSSTQTRRECHRLNRRPASPSVCVYKKFLRRQYCIINSGGYVAS